MLANLEELARCKVGRGSRLQVLHELPAQRGVGLEVGQGAEQGLAPAALVNLAECVGPRRVVA